MILLDDRYDEHPTIAGLSDPAFRVWHRGLAWSARHLSDGFVPTGVAKQLAGSRFKKISDELVEAELWEVKDGGWSSPEYLKWNWTQDEALAHRAATRGEHVRAGQARARGPCGRDGRFTSETSGASGGTSGGTPAEPAEEPARVQPMNHKAMNHAKRRLADTDVSSGQVSPSATSSSSRAVNPEDLHEVIQDLLGVEGWPLEEKGTRAVALKLFAEFDVPAEDLVFAVGSYACMDPIKAKSAAGAFNAVRSWLAVYFRREHLKSLIKQFSDGKYDAMNEEVEQLLEDEVGTSRFAEMNAKDVEAAITVLEAHIV